MCVRISVCARCDGLTGGRIRNGARRGMCGRRELSASRGWSADAQKMVNAAISGSVAEPTGARASGIARRIRPGPRSRAGRVARYGPALGRSRSACHRPGHQIGAEQRRSLLGLGASRLSANCRRSGLVLSDTDGSELAWIHLVLRTASADQLSRSGRRLLRAPAQV